MLSARLKSPKFWLSVAGLFLLSGTSVVWAAAASSSGGGGIGTIAANITQGLTNVAKLITAGSYVAGMAFAVGAIAKFKAHKEAPTQVPLSTPIALLFVGIALIFAPAVFQAGGATLFGSGASSGKGSAAGSATFGSGT